MSGLDFSGLTSLLLPQLLSLLEAWVPGGKLQGKEYVAGSIQGGAGRSFSCNIETGKFADFSTGEKGGDPIALYAAIHGITQKESYERLARVYGFHGATPNPDGSSGHGQGNRGGEPSRALAAAPTPTFPPANNFPAKDSAVAEYQYRTLTGDLIYIVRRYEDGGKKSFRPFSWDGTTWVNKSWPAPRPLYGLDILAAHPDAPVLIVEGEKACHAARSFAGGRYVVMTWPNGSNSWQKADWRPLANRSVLLWPDADSATYLKGHEHVREGRAKIGDLMPYTEQPGVKAMAGIAEELAKLNCSIKTLSVRAHANGWDAADANFDWSSFVQWGKSVAVPYANPVTRLAPSPQPPTARIEITKNEPPDPVCISYAATWDNCGLALTKNGHPIVNMDNVLRVLEAITDLKAIAWYDEFHNKILTVGRSGEPRPWSNSDDIGLTIRLQRDYGLTKITTAIVRDTIIHLAGNNRRNEPRDWMESLVWDGTPRIETFFHLYLGAKVTDYTLAASKNWWVSMAARIYKPGCKVDTMAILEGEQGAKKSSVFEIIGGRWYKQLTESFDSKDLFIGFQGKLIIEVAELDAFGKADINTIKKIVSNPSDHYRPLYERQNADAPRRSIFVGTTNQSAYLDDETGARRFWPIDCKAIDLEAVRRDRDQLFAEAAHAYKSGSTWWEMPRQSTLEEQEMRYRGDPWQEDIARFLDFGMLTPYEVITTTTLAHGALHIDVGRVDQLVTKRIARVMKKLGWVSRVTWDDGKSVRKWHRS